MPKKAIQKLYTWDGKPVYTNGSKHYSLTRETDYMRHMQRDASDASSPYQPKLLAKIEAQIGGKCEWRNAGMQEYINVSIPGL